jgi:hypothetical protein
MQGPGYTVKDLFYYGGLFAGIILVSTTLQPWGIHPLFRLLLGLGLGVGLGWLLERIYENMVASRRSPEDLDEPPHQDL